jgi:hypothetical protein
MLYMNALSFGSLRRFSPTRPTLPPNESILPDMNVGVRVVEGMPTVTRLHQRTPSDAHTTNAVLSVRHDLKMRRLATDTVSTEVVELFPGWNRPYEGFVHDAMNYTELSVPDRNVPVAAARLSPLPFPTISNQDSFEYPFDYALHSPSVAYCNRHWHWSYKGRPPPSHEQLVALALTKAEPS